MVPHLFSLLGRETWSVCRSCSERLLWASQVGGQGVFSHRPKSGRAQSPVLPGILQGWDGL